MTSRIRATSRLALTSLALAFALAALMPAAATAQSATTLCQKGTKVKARIGSCKSKEKQIAIIPAGAAAVQSQVDANAAAIATSQADIASNSAGIAANAAKIEENATYTSTVGHSGSDEDTVLEGTQVVAKQRIWHRKGGPLWVMATTSIYQGNPDGNSLVGCSISLTPEYDSSREVLTGNEGLNRWSPIAAQGYFHLAEDEWASVYLVCRVINPAGQTRFADPQIMALALSAAEVVPGPIR